MWGAGRKRYYSLSSSILPFLSHYLHFPVPKYKDIYPFRPSHILLSSLFVVVRRYSLVFFNPHHIYVPPLTLGLASVFFRSSIYCLQKCQGDLKTQELTGGCIREGVLVLPQDEDTEIFLEDLNTIQGRIKVLQEQVEAGRKKLQVSSCSPKNFSTHVYVIDHRALKAH